jgi:alkylation response protein AidB-like acyl-CoA dehydrogenase
MDTSLVAAARALAPELATHTDAHVRDRQLAPAVVTALEHGGWLRLLVPRALDGAAVAPSTYVEVLASLAAGDAATAWVVMTASTSTLLASYLPPDAARAIWGDGAAPLLAGVFAPGGRATVDGDELVVSGRWPYASGCRHASRIAVGALVGTPPAHLVCIAPIDAPGVTIVDTWDPIGLAGTGSHDVVFEDVRVPRAMTASVFTAVAWPDEPLARVPLFGLLALGIAGVGLGIARNALARASERVAAPRDGAAPASATLAHLGDLTARLAAATAYATGAGDRALAAATDHAITDVTRGELRLAAAHAARESAMVTRAAFHLIGGGAIGRTSPLARAVADAEVMLTHRMVADRVRPAAARAVLGLGAARDL